MRGIVCEGDPTDHGGYVLQATSTYFINGKAAALMGDLVWCPKEGHGANPIVEADESMFSDGKQIVVDGCRSACGCRVLASSHEAGIVDEAPDFDFEELMPDHAPKWVQIKPTAPEPLPLPSLIFETQNKMDDYDAPDMKHGDLTEEALKERFGLIDVSDRVDAYKRSLLKEDNKVRVAELFEEFKDLSDLFSWYGKYNGLMRKMITHMQQNTGQTFTDPLLDQAMKERILEDTSENSSLLIIRETLQTNIKKDYGIYPLSQKNIFVENIGRGRLPKFTDIKDLTNGLFVSVHDIWAAHIILESLSVNDNQFKAVVHYRIQDHFGLDEKDITNNLFKPLRLFRIWFVLQRWEYYGYKPFITEMNVTLPIEGSLL